MAVISNLVVANFRNNPLIKPYRTAQMLRFVGHVNIIGRSPHAVHEIVRIAIHFFSNQAVYVSLETGQLLVEVARKF